MAALGEVMRAGVSEGVGMRLELGEHRQRGGEGESWAGSLDQSRGRGRAVVGWGKRGRRAGDALQAERQSLGGR